MPSVSVSNLQAKNSSRFAQPAFIQELGEEGLTATQIAQSLCVDLKHVHEKLKRNNWKSKGMNEWRTVVFTTHQSYEDVTGRIVTKKITTYLLNTNAAKAFVARYANEIGDAYLQFLFDCEAAAFLQAKKSMERKQKFAHKKHIIRKPVYEENLFGEMQIVRFEEINPKNATNLEMCEATLCHLELISTGISKRRQQELKTLNAEVHAIAKNLAIKV